MADKKEIGFEEWLKVISTMNDKELRECLSFGNVHVDIHSSPTRVKEGLIKTGKFRLAPDCRDQGKYQLDHLETGARVLVKYDGIERDYLENSWLYDIYAKTGSYESFDYSKQKWADPEPNESKISIHPSPTGWGSSSFSRRTLPDILEFGKSEGIGLEGNWKMPVSRGKETVYENTSVRYIPEGDKR